MNQPRAAPSVPGLTYIRHLGSGGFADVYLYKQAMPAREVAVKVLREMLSQSLVRRFLDEANIMAQLEHPHIVPVYAAGMTPEGLPYIQMMYYPRENLGLRVRREPLGVSETLRVGIQIASALETAHKADLLHRDIKPANILTSRFGAPGLADFGIASRLSATDDEDAGVSPPWAPPEALYPGVPITVRSDVYSLGATLWHLLVGRSPFVIPQGDNSAPVLIRRVRDVPPPSTGRADVPGSLDRLLRVTLSKEPRFRPASAAELARSLQAIEQEMRLPRTEFVMAAEDFTSARMTPIPPKRHGTRFPHLWKTCCSGHCPRTHACAPQRPWSSSVGCRGSSTTLVCRERRVNSPTIKASRWRVPGRRTIRVAIRGSRRLHASLHLPRLR